LDFQRGSLKPPPHPNPEAPGTKLTSIP